MDHFESARAPVIFVAAGIAAGLLLWAILPPAVIVVNDDFGYLRSVLETAARGRPWTDDWLEPWSASLSVISALILKATGSFQLATQGLQIVLRAVGVLIAARLLSRRGQGPWSSAVIALLIFASPTLLWKGLEFTALVLYVPCLLLALDASERNRWGLFSLYAALALASRQSALAWFVLPVAALAQNFQTGNRPTMNQMKGPLLACLAGAATYFICRHGMNPTQAQKVMTSGMWQSLRIASWLHWMQYAILLLLACVGLANGLAWLRAGRGLTWSGRTGREFCLRALLPAIGLLGLLGWHGRFDLQLEHELFAAPAGLFYLRLCAMLALAGWLVAPVTLDLRLLTGALACAALTSLRPAIWDYYWTDLALFAFFAGFGPSASPPVFATGSRLSVNFRRAAALLIAGLFVVPSVAFVNAAKRSLDSTHAAETILEKSLRQGEISPADLSVAPFGFRGWHLYPYFIKTKEGAGAYIADFARYVSDGSLVWETRGANNPNPLEHPENVVRSEVFAIGWRGERHQFILRRQTPRAAAADRIDFTRYQYQPFPLTAAEWREWKPPLPADRR